MEGEAGFRSAWDKASSNPRVDIKGSREEIEILSSVAVAFSCAIADGEYSISERYGIAPASAIRVRVSGSFLDMRRSSQSDSVRVCSDTELSFPTSVFAVRRFTSMLFVTIRSLCSSSLAEKSVNWNSYQLKKSEIMLIVATFLLRSW